MLSPSKTVNDGKWHHIIIDNQTRKKKRKFTIILDGRKDKPKRVPPNKISDKMYIGDIPKQMLHKVPKVGQLVTLLVLLCCK